jgi:hypothetical protein
LLALILQGSTGGHMLLVEHSRCTEHGELVHGHAPDDLGAATREQTQGSAFETRSEGGSDAAHEHCGLSANRRDALATIVDARLHPEVVETVERLLVRRAALAPQTTLIRIAPKNSPPA